MEVKNTVAIHEAHRYQAIRQAWRKRLPWMLMSKISGTSEWLIQRRGESSAVWREKDGMLELPVRGEVS